MRFFNSCVSRCATVALLMSAVAPGGASAGPGNHFYAGVALTFEQREIFYDKITDNLNAPNPITQPFPAAGMVFETRSSDDDTGLSGTLLAGYRHYLQPGGLYVAAEIDVAFYNDVVRGYLPGDGVPASIDGDDSNRQSGEAWPETWTFDKDLSLGLTAKIGGHPDFMSRLLGEGATLYALGGYRKVDVDFRAKYTGCSPVGPNRIPAPCPSINPQNDFRPGSFNRDENLYAWVAGLGAGARIDDNKSLNIELRYTDYRDHNWKSLPSRGALVVPAEIGGHEWGLRLTLLRRF